MGCCNSKPPSGFKTKKRIVVIGDGPAAVMAVRELQEYCSKLTCISPKMYTEVPWCNVRAVTDKQFPSATIIPLADVFNRSVKVVHGYVTSVQKKFVTVSPKTDEVDETTEDDTEDDELSTMDELQESADDGALRVSYDYLIIATGAKNASILAGDYDLSLKARRKELVNLASKMKKAKKVLIVGGGATAVEIAGELVPDHEVTIVTAGMTLLEGFSTGVQKYATNFLLKKGVSIHYEDRVVTRPAQGEKSCVTKKAHKISFDEMVWAVGTRPNTDFLRNGALKKALTNKGLIKVGDTLAVDGFENIYAVGDCNDLPINKVGFNAKQQGTLVADNILNLIQGRPTHKYGTPPDVRALMLGPDDGSLQTPLCNMQGCCCGCVPVLLKSKGAFLNQSRSDYGLKS